MDGYRFDRLYLSDAPPGSGDVDRLTIARRALGALEKARHHDLVHTHGETASLLCLPALVRSRSVATLHGLHLVRRTRGIAHRSARMSLWLIVTSASTTICVSSTECEDARAIVGDRAARRLRVVRNGVDPAPAPTLEERAAARKQLGLEPSALVGLYAGALDPHKDPLIAVRATLELARRGRPVALLVAGDGPLRGEIDRLAAGVGGGAIHVLGHRRDMRPVLAAADFFVLPSHREGLSFALLEAMALGLVPIVSDAAGNPEAVGDAGFVVTRGDTDALVAAIDDLLARPEACPPVGERARRRVREDWSAETMVAATARVYDELTGARRET